MSRLQVTSNILDMPGETETSRGRNIVVDVFGFGGARFSETDEAATDVVADRKDIFVRLRRFRRAPREKTPEEDVEAPVENRVRRVAETGREMFPVPSVECVFQQFIFPVPVF